MSGSLNQGVAIICVQIRSGSRILMRIWQSVKLGNNSKMTVLGKGNIRLQIDVVTQVITDVFYILELKNNLLSVGQLQERGVAILIQHGVRARHGSVRAGFGPFGHPTRAPWVFEISTRNSNANVENRRVSGGSDRVFLVGFVVRVGFLGDFQPQLNQTKT
jgi:hypothetical protein